jgi:hypothetical protein
MVTAGCIPCIRRRFQDDKDVHYKEAVDVISAAGIINASRTDLSGPRAI